MTDFKLYVDRFATPLGELTLVANGAGTLRAVAFSEGQKHLEKHLAGCAGANVKLVERKDPNGLSCLLRAYFAGELDAIAGLSVDPQGTPFQQQVWRALLEIPCGETRTYGDIARRIGNPAAVRAVGLANGKNPIGIVIPCHRVIGANGTLTGYGGGVDRKRWLLAHEGRAGMNLELPLGRPPDEQAGPPFSGLTAGRPTA